MNQVLKEDEGLLVEGSELGKKSSYEASYNPHCLYPIPRAEKRREIGIDPDKLPFFGYDCWNHYEVSWLNNKGKPMVGLAEIIYDCRSPKIIESKSLKLYFNSFNNTNIENATELQQIIHRDLSACLETEVSVKILPLHSSQYLDIRNFSGQCLDDLDITCSVYSVAPEFLAIEEDFVEEVVYSDLLKSNCLVTHQPDWGSVQIAYQGRKINHQGLLKYLISFRNHNEFHEQCIERIFQDIMQRCQPEQLSVYGRYTRRGGLDINPYRSTTNNNPEKNQRLIRQ